MTYGDKPRSRRARDCAKIALELNAELYRGRSGWIVRCGLWTTHPRTPSSIDHRFETLDGVASFLWKLHESRDMFGKRINPLSAANTERLLVVQPRPRIYS